MDETGRQGGHRHTHQGGSLIGGDQHGGPHVQRLDGGALRQAPAQHRQPLPRDLEGAAGPATALLDGLPEGEGLLVIGHRLGYPGDGHPGQGTLGGHLQVLADALGAPAAHLVKGGGGHHESGASQHSRHAQPRLALIVEPVHHPIVDGVAAGDGAVKGVLAVPVALGRPGSRPVGVVHLPQELGIGHVIRVKDAEGVVPLIPQLPVGKAHHISLALHRDGALHDIGPEILGGLGGVVGTVVGDDPDVVQLPRIILGQQAVDQISDHQFLIPGSHQNCKAGAGRVPAIVHRLAPGHEGGHQIIAAPQGHARSHQSRRSHPQICHPRHMGSLLLSLCSQCTREMLRFCHKLY